MTQIRHRCLFRNVAHTQKRQPPDNSLQPGEKGMDEGSTRQTKQHLVHSQAMHVSEIVQHVRGQEAKRPFAKRDAVIPSTIPPTTTERRTRRPIEVIQSLRHHESWHRS